MSNLPDGMQSLRNWTVRISVLRDEAPNSLQALSISGLESRILMHYEVTVIVWSKAGVDIGVFVLTSW